MRLAWKRFIDKTGLHYDYRTGFPQGAAANDQPGANSSLHNFSSS